MSADDPRREDLIIHEPTFVLLFEHLERDFDLLSKVVGFENRGLPFLNSSNSPSLDISQDLNAKIAAIYKIDYDILNSFIQEKHISLYL